MLRHILLTLMTFCLFFLLSVSIGYAEITATTKDGKAVLLKDDGTWHYAGQKSERLYEVSYNKTYFYAEDGYEKRVRVKFRSTEEVKSKVPEDKLSSISSGALSVCQLKLRNQVSFVPLDVFLMHSEESGALYSVSMLGKNAYGAESKTSCYCKIPPDYEIELDSCFLSLSRG